MWASESGYKPGGFFYLIVENRGNKNAIDAQSSTWATYSINIEDMD